MTELYRAVSLEKPDTGRYKSASHCYLATLVRYIRHALCRWCTKALPTWLMN